MENQKTSRSWKWANLIVSALFALLIWLPLCDSIFGLDPTPEHQGARKSPQPELHLTRTSINQFPEKFESFYNTQFGFRNTLITLQNLLKVYVLHAYISGDVVIGKDGWLFLDQNQSLEGYRGTLPLFTTAELDRWHRLFQSRHDRLAEQGIRFLVVFAPNKNTIYPEYMPDGLNRIDGQRRLDQMVAYLEEHAEYDFIDLRQPLIAGKDIEPTFYKTDTHWNQFGSFIAYKEIMEKVKPWFPAISPFCLEDLRRQIKPSFNTGLPRMLGLEGALSEDAVLYNPLKVRSTSTENSEIISSFDYGVCPAPRT
ncbi:MAG: hypothetical protein ABIK28_06685, partial [Planctomycetota bacterium]